MPRVKVTVPEQLLQVAGSRAEELDKSLSELFTEAIERYVRVTEDASPGSLRSRHAIPRSSPVIAVEIPEALYQRANQVAKRLGKRREVMYCEALAAHVPQSTDAPSAFDRGHDLSNAAWRRKDGE